MANEITIVASLAYADSSIFIAQLLLSIASPGTFTIGTPRAVQNVMSVPTTAGGTAIPLGSVATPGWAAFKNNDVTNYIELLTATSGTKFAKLPPKGIALLYIPSSVTAPAALANTGACLMEYLILNV